MGEIGQGIGFGDRGHVFVYVNRVSSALNPPSALYSFDSNGTQLWKVESGDYSSSPMIVDKAGTVIYSASGIIHAVDKNGSKLWSSDAGEYVVSIGLDSGGRLYILSQNDLAVSNGIPKVTWIDWISRNPLWDLAIVIVSLAVVYVAVIARHWKKNPPNEELHNIR
jgi:outer membrane protein assembly factor BamB